MNFAPTDEQEMVQEMDQISISRSDVGDPRVYEAVMAVLTERGA